MCTLPSPSVAPHAFFGARAAARPSRARFRAIAARAGEAQRRAGPNATSSEICFVPRMQTSASPCSEAKTFRSRLIQTSFGVHAYFVRKRCKLKYFK